MLEPSTATENKFIDRVKCLTLPFLHDLIFHSNPFHFRPKRTIFFLLSLSLSPVGQTFLPIFSLKGAKNMSKGTPSRIRDAKNGQFVKKGTEKRRPATTVKETIKKK